MSPLCRPWFATLVVASTCAGVAFGQSESTGSSGSSGSSAPTAPAADTTGAASSFGSSTAAPSSIFSTGTAGPRQEAPPSFVVPGLYGQGAQTYYGGVGRLARPKFETRLSFGFGYDDNVYQTPRDVPRILPGGSSAVDTPKVEVVLEDAEAGGQPIFEDRTIFRPGGGTIVRPVLVGFTEDKEPVLGFVDVPQAKPLGSFFSRADFGFQTQQFTRKSLFTLDFNVGRTYYWEKDQDPIDYNGGLSLTFLQRLTPRLQVTSLVSASYLSQPDLSLANTPERQINGDLIYVNSRVELSYRVTPRFSMSVSGAYSGQLYTETSEESGNSNELTVGIEARYLWQPRWTFLTEFRHTMRSYPNNTALDSTTDFFLIGSEFTLNPRLSGSLRLGVSAKQFKSSGDSQFSPYLESSVSYRSTARSVVTWTNRFGFEEPGSPDEERLVYRSTIGYSYAFSPKISGVANINLIHEISTNKVTDTEFAQDTFDATLGLQYQITRNFSMNGNYTFTLTNSNTRVSDYYRNRVSFGGEYTF